MALAGIEYLGIAVEPAGRVPRLHLCHGSEQVSHYSNWTSEGSSESKASTLINNSELRASREVIRAGETYKENEWFM